MIIKYSGPDDIDMLINMCEKLPHLHTQVLFSSHKRFSESAKELSELIEHAMFQYDGKVRAKQTNDTLSAEFENGSCIVVAVAKECIRARRAHIIACDPDIDKELLRHVVMPCDLRYNQIRDEEIQGILSE